MINATNIQKQTIFGYQVKERIGSGGYGEVWSAEAPGGLMKAIKILYGYHDEQRAQNELKSLERIKQLRHPYLLSLERIDILDGQMIVITELADRSLSDLFDEYQQQGNVGIPRAELLTYMSQAAEVLDFISTEHTLQHLDIKPENLLLVGKHLKLADFGLVKDLRDNSQSLMGGLTPAYAAPELFDGRPTTTSDQYSLAIVYCELLTGQRPFNGTTPAQLAAQHIHGQPDLQILPKQEQDIIAKALSKNPELRFRSCKQLIDSIINVRMLANATKRSNIRARNTMDTKPREVKIRSSIMGTSTHQLTDGELTAKKESVNLVGTPDFDPSNAKLSPHLIIGIGKTGTDILQQLKQRLAAHYGDAQQWPAIRLLAIDTDRSSLHDGTAGVSHSGLAPSETLALPLRKPEHYRTRAKVHASWLNRRWIYNVPKSLQTEGLRPIGRLALADNFELLCQALESQLEVFKDPSTLEKTAEHLQLPMGDHSPQVYLVGAITGGLASGTMLDISYAVKSLISEYGFEADRIHGLLIDANDSRKRDAGLSTANAFAFLTELRHLTQQGYPGDTSMGIPSSSDMVPIDFPYWLKLGDNCTNERWRTQLSNVAEYLFMNICTPSQSFFRACRDLENEQDSFTLRSFGLFAAESCQIGTLSQLTDYCCDQFVKKLAQGDDPNVLDSAAVETMELQTHTIVNRIASDNDWVKLLAPTQLQDLVNSWNGYQAAGVLPNLSGLETQANDVFGGIGNLTDLQFAPDTALPSFAKPIQAAVQELNEIYTAQIHAMFRGPVLNFRRIENTLKSLIQSLDTQRHGLKARMTGFAEELRQLQQAWNTISNIAVTTPNKLNPQEAHQCFNRYLKLRNAILATRVQASIWGRAKGALEQLGSEVKLRKDHLHSSVRFVDTPHANVQAPTTQNPFQDQIIQEILLKGDEFLARANATVFMSVILKQPGGYWQLLLDSNFLKSYFSPAIVNAVRQELADYLKHVSWDQLLERMGDADEVGPLMKRWAEQAAAWIHECGGTGRVLVATPQYHACPQTLAHVKQQYPVPTADSAETLGAVMIVTEADQIQLADVAYKLVEARADCMELATRLLTRSDVNWKSLADLL